VNVAVLGGTGFVGHHLVKKLLETNHHLTLLVHRHLNKEISYDNINVIYGDIETIDSLDKAFENIDVVYHLVGIIAETKDKKFDKTVAEGTKNVVKACIEKGVKKIIYLSALGTSKSAKTKYHQTKYQAEQAIETSGLNFIIYRPSIVYGPGDSFISQLSKIIKWFPFTPVIGSGKYLFQPIFIDDLIQAMVLGLEIPEATGQIIDIAGPEKLEYLKILNIIKKVLRKKRLNFYIPITVMKKIAFCLEKIMKPSPITREQLLMMEMGNTGDISTMEKLFSIKPIDLENGLKKYLR